VNRRRTHDDAIFARCAPQAIPRQRICPTSELRLRGLFPRDEARDGRLLAAHDRFAAAELEQVRHEGVDVGGADLLRFDGDEVGELREIAVIVAEDVSRL
jgi:hypothetical protein